MDSSPIMIICDSPKIFHPKPKRNHKIMNNKEHFRKKEIKRIMKKNSLNLESISLQDIENDFIELKSKKEEFEVQKELSFLIKKANNVKNENIIKYNRPKNPLYNTANNIELFI